jgi:drug/metabolite transporter (DMT)-like permease
VPGVAIATLLAGANIFFVFSILLTTVANTLFLFASVPVFSAVFGWVFLNQALQLRTAVALVIGMAGVTAIFANGLQQGSIAGDLFALIAAFLFAANLTVISAYPHTRLLPSLILAGILAVSVSGLVSDPFKADNRDVAILIASGAIQQTVGVLLFQWAARILPAAEIGLLALVETVFGPVWVWLAIGELPSPIALVAGVVILFTLLAHSLLAMREQSRPAPP